jgi:hypothetical protein
MPLGGAGMGASGWGGLDLRFLGPDLSFFGPGHLLAVPGAGVLETAWPLNEVVGSCCAVFVKAEAGGLGSRAGDHEFLRP